MLSRHGYYLHESDLEPLHLAFHPEAVGPDQPHHSTQIQPALIVAAHLLSMKHVLLNQPRHVIPQPKALMHVSRIPILELRVHLIQSGPTYFVSESVIHNKFDEDYILIRSDSVHNSRNIFGLRGMHHFSGSMSDYLFAGGVGFSLCIAVGVYVSPGVISGFVMIALSAHHESSHQIASLGVLCLEHKAIVDMAEVLGKAIAAAGDDQIEEIRSDADSDGSSPRKVSFDVQDYRDDYSGEEDDGSEEGSAVDGSLPFDDWVGVGLGGEGLADVLLDGVVVLDRLEVGEELVGGKGRRLVEEGVVELVWRCLHGD